jgi:glycosyltransferase involved in cell wall biosynthesis
MLRVFLHTNQAGLGGTERVVEVIAKHLDRSLFEPYIVWKGLPGQPREKNFIEAVGSSRCIRYQMVDEWKQAFGDLKPDIVHVHRGMAADFPAPLDCPGSTFIEHSIFGHFDADHGIDKTLYVSMWLNHYAAPEWRFRNWFYKERGYDRFGVFPNPIEAPHPEALERAKDPTRRIVIGRISRPDDSIVDELWIQMLERLWGVHVIVQSPPPRFRHLANKFVFLGQEQGVKGEFRYPTAEYREISQFYRDIDILTHSRKDGETSGVCILEAMAHGVPVVSHRGHPFNAHEELFTGIASEYLVDRGDIDGYMDRLQKLISDDHERSVLGQVLEIQSRRWRWENLIPLKSANEGQMQTLEQIYIDVHSRKQSRTTGPGAKVV